jgi:threonylcarbamoyladenosine tRNA methylthiotransferase MtaB
MLKTQEEISRELNSALIGKTVRILCEETEDGFVLGHSSENLVVRVKGNEDMIGTFVNTKITAFDGVLYGEILN